MLRHIGFMAMGADDEFDRNDIGPLMQQLEKRMLRIGARLSPDQRAGRTLQGMAVPVHRFAVRLHIELLQIGGKP